jgi:hypothetical protein
MNESEITMAEINPRNGFLLVSFISQITIPIV